MSETFFCARIPWGSSVPAGQGAPITAAMSTLCGRISSKVAMSCNPSLKFHRTKFKGEILELLLDKKKFLNLRNLGVSLVIIPPESSISSRRRT